MTSPVMTGGRQDALAQILADFSNNILVRACAGSGKTRLLSAKCLLALMLRGNRQVAAITFTEKAAQELKGRILYFLNMILTAPSEEYLELKTDFPWAEFRQALAAQKEWSRKAEFWPKLKQRSPELFNQLTHEGAQIGTIHGFAKRILDRYPLEAMGGLLTHFDHSGRGLEQLLEEFSAEEVFLASQNLSGVSYRQLNELVKDMLDAVKRGMTLTGGSDFSFDRSSAFAKNLAGSWAAFSTLVFEAIDASREQGYLDYDLILYWLDAFLATAQPSLLQEIRARNNYVLLDELQDTDPLQLRIIRRLSAYDAPQGGRLFMVGDPFQSIYGFRGACPELIFEGQAKKDFKEWSLIGNKRSGPGILNFINNAFAGILQGYEPMGSTQSREFSVDKILWHAYGQAGEPSLAADERRRQEARHAAETIKTLAARHGWPWKNFAVLLRKMKHGWVYLEELTRQGIPAVLGVSANEALKMSQTVRDLFWAGQLFLNPESAEARAYFKLCCDGNAEAVFNAVGSLRESHFETASPGAIITALKQALNLESRALALNLEERQALDWAESLAWKTTGDAASYLQGLREKIEATGRDDDQEEPPQAPWDGDCVKIATIHKVKGLQFPCVILAGVMDWDSRKSHKKLLWDPMTAKAAVVFKAGTKKFLGSDEALARELKESGGGGQSAEEQRVLYVALTRAQECLVVMEPQGAALPRRPGTYSRDVANSLSKAKPRGEIFRCALCLGGPGEPKGAVTAAWPVSAGVSEANAVAVHAQHKTEVVSTPPALVYASREDEGSWQEDPVEPRKKRDDGDTRLLGTALHGVLERVAWKPAVNHSDYERILNGELEKINRQEGGAPAGLKTQAETVLKNFFKSALWTDLACKKLIAREYPVAYLKEGSLVVGRVDLIYEEAPGTLVIADWKTETVSAQAHRAQGEHYQRALEGLGRRVSAKKIIFEVISLRDFQSFRLD
ncbi:MAG: UvrD-helicase domain-containing protein [Elusimicrobia bacterium]|nr:UvrD-helicase domain-containing protein [Elusimicrobiota bacterium]